MQLFNFNFCVKFPLIIIGLLALLSVLSNGCNAPVELPDCVDTIAEDTTNIPDTLIGLKPLILVIKNLAAFNSPVNVVFYKASNTFLSKTDRFKKYKYTSDGNTLTVQINNLSYGEFAIATYQDVNKDGVCNRNIIGVPKEPYGFSNDFKPKIKAPSFNDCKFAYNEKADTLTLSMIR